jgi:hypothetical protein
MDSYGAYSGGGTYTVFIGSRNLDTPGVFATANIYNNTHLGFDMDLGAESPNANRFISIMVIQ